MRILTLLLFFGLYSSSVAQLFSDNIVQSSLDFNLSPIKLVGVIDEGSGSTSYSGGSNGRPIDTDYNLVEVNAMTATLMARLGLSSFLYETSSLEFRSDINIGLGYRFSVKDALGLEGMIMNVPAYLRTNLKSKDKFGFLLGYHYTTGGLRSHLPVVGIEFGDVSNERVRIYSSVIPYRWYNYYTDGTEEPGVSIMKFGIEWIVAY